MNKIRNLFWIPLFVAVLLQSGCGDSPLAEGGMGGTGISVGTVTGIGSVTVNGVTFDTDDAAIYVEKERIDNPDLADATGAFLLAQGFSEGQVVRVVGSFDDNGRTGTADEVYYNDSVEGPVLSITPIDANTSEIVVMGQTIIVDTQTVLDEAPTIDPADIIEVSGLRDDAGKIRAGYVRNITVSGQDPDSSTENEVKGVIDTVTGNFKFTIKSLTVDYANADTSAIPGGTPIAGLQVEVKGTFNGSELLATKVELEDDISGDDDDDVEYEGIVSSIPTPITAGISFVMGVQTVETGSNTIFKGGLVEDVVIGAHLEVEGHLQGNTLIANEVRFRDSIEIDAQVAGHTTTPAEDSVTITLTGLNGINVLVNSESEINVNPGADDLAGLIAALRTVGDTDYVEVRGRCLNCVTPLPVERDVYAEEIKLDDNTTNSKVKLQGQIEEIDGINNSITILGIFITTDATMEFEAIDDTTILTQTEFFNLITVGNLVGADGTLNAGNVDWDKLEIEDEE